LEKPGSFGKKVFRFFKDFLGWPYVSNRKRCVFALFFQVSFFIIHRSAITKEWTTTEIKEKVKNYPCLEEIRTKFQQDLLIGFEGRGILAHMRPDSL